MKIIKNSIFLVLLIVLICSIVFSVSVAENNTVKSDEDIFIIFSAYDLHGPFFVASTYGFVRQMNRMGLRCAVMDAGAVLQRQLDQIDDAIARGADAIVMIPMDSDALSLGVEKCNLENIPVFTIDRSVTDGHVTTTLQTDNVEAGRKVAREFIKIFKERGMNDNVNLLQIRGQLGSSPSRDRDEGFWEVMQLHPEININVIAKTACDWNNTKSMEATLAHLTAHEEINTIFYEADYMASGVFAAMEQVGRLVPIGDPNHIVNGGVDGDKHALESLRKNLMDVTVSQMPYSQGITSAYLAYHAVKYDGGNELAPQLYFDVQTLTPENVDEFGALWGDLPIGGADIPDELKKLLLR